MIDTLRQCFAILEPRDRRRWGGLLVLAVISSLVEAFGAGAVYALIKIISAPHHASSLPVVGVIYDFLPWREPTQVVIAFTALVALFYVAKNGILAAAAYAQSRVASEGIASVSAAMMRRYLAAPFPFHLQHGSAELINKTTHSVQVLHNTMLRSAVLLLSEVLVVAGISSVLLWAAPVATLGSLAILAVLLTGALRITKRAFARWGKSERRLSERIVLDVQQSLGGIKEVKVLGREAHFHESFEEQQKALSRVRWLRGTMSAIPRLTVELVFVLAMLAFVTLIVTGEPAGADVVPLLGLSAYAGFRIIPSANRILMFVNNMRFGGPHARFLHSDFTTLPPAPPEAFESPSPDTLPFEREIALRDVSYAYPGVEVPVLRDVSLEVRRGESVGVVGPTGAGKSTLVYLLLGLIGPTSGRIEVDGADVSAALRAWRGKLGYVPQDPFLLDDTIRRNIAFGQRDEAVDAARVERALAMAQLDGFVRSLPEGLDTIVGERGVRLSGGQRQRIAIARALYHQPEVLVFDEATSALDNRTERELTRAIDALQGEKTLIIVAHRLTTVRGCDRLVFLRDGRVDGVGSFDDLLERSEPFRAMAAAPDASSG